MTDRDRELPRKIDSIEDSEGGRDIVHYLLIGSEFVPIAIVGFAELVHNSRGERYFRRPVTQPESASPYYYKYVPECNILISQ